jgi:hypothetical protein
MPPNIILEPRSFIQQKDKANFILFYLQCIVSIQLHKRSRQINGKKTSALRVIRLCNKQHITFFSFLGTIEFVIGFS